MLPDPFDWGLIPPRDPGSSKHSTFQKISSSKHTFRHFGRQMRSGFKTRSKTTPWRIVSKIPWSFGITVGSDFGGGLSTQENRAGKLTDRGHTDVVMGLWESLFPAPSLTDISNWPSKKRWVFFGMQLVWIEEEKCETKRRGIQILRKKTTIESGWVEPPADPVDPSSSKHSIFQHTFRPPNTVCIQNPIQNNTLENGFQNPKSKGFGITVGSDWGGRESYQPKKTVRDPGACHRFASRRVASRDGVPPPILLLAGMSSALEKSCIPNYSVFISICITYIFHYLPKSWGPVRSLKYCQNPDPPTAQQFFWTQTTNKNGFEQYSSTFLCGLKCLRNYLDT